MGANGDAGLQSEFDAAAHGIVVTRVPAAGYIRGTDKRKNSFIAGHAFAHVAVEVNG
jgi:hypothetical protein